MARIDAKQRNSTQIGGSCREVEQNGVDRRPERREDDWIDAGRRMVADQRGVMRNQCGKVGVGAPAAALGPWPAVARV
jgi:hypothetical protein